MTQTLKKRQAQLFPMKTEFNVKRMNFMGNKQYLSKYNKKTYVGKCDKCLEMCGINM